MKFVFKLGNHEYIDIARLRFGKFYSWEILGAIFSSQMLIYANWRKNNMIDLIFFNKNVVFQKGNHQNY